MSNVIDSLKLELIFREAVTPPPPPGNIKRWMDEGDIVSFSVYRKCGRDNAEFKINGRADWLIWFSQLYTVFYSGDLKNGSICSFKLKDGSYVFPNALLLDEFLEAIKGKRFKVSIDPTSCFCVNKNSPKVRCLPFNKFNEIYEYVHNHILEGDIESVKGMLKPTRCYDLVEI